MFNAAKVEKSASVHSRNWLLLLFVVVIAIETSNNKPLKCFVIYISKTRERDDLVVRFSNLHRLLAIGVLAFGRSVGRYAFGESDVCRKHNVSPNRDLYFFLLQLCNFFLSYLHKRQSIDLEIYRETLIYIQSWWRIYCTFLCNR